MASVSNNMIPTAYPATDPNAAGAATPQGAPPAPAAEQTPLVDPLAQASTGPVSPSAQATIAGTAPAGDFVNTTSTERQASRAQRGLSVSSDSANETGETSGADAADAEIADAVNEAEGTQEEDKLRPANEDFKPFTVLEERQWRT